MPFPVRTLLLAVLLLVSPAGPAAHAQDAPPAAEPAPDAPTPERLRDRIAATEGDTTIDAAERDAVLAELRAALDAATRASGSRAEAKTLRDAAGEAPARVEQARAELASPPAPVTIDAQPDMSTDAVRDAVRSANQELESARADLQAVQTEATRRTTRLDEIPRELADARARLAELQGEPAIVGGSPRDEARRLHRAAEIAALNARIERAEAEVASYRARQDLLPLRRDLAQRRVDRAQRRAELWQAKESERLREAAAQREREARKLERDATLLAPPLRQLAEETAAFAARRAGDDGIVTRLSDARARLSAIDARLAELRTRSISTIAKVDAAGLSDAVGVVLRKELANLPDPRPIRAEREALRKRIGDAQYQLIVVDERLSEVSDIEAAVPRLVDRVDRADVTADDATLEATARELLTAERAVLSDLRAEYTDFIEVAADLDAAMGQFVRLATDYRAFIEQRVLWSRSVPGTLVPPARDFADPVRWAIDPQQWEGVALTISRNAWPPRPGVPILALLTILAIILARRARARLNELADLVKKFTTDRFRHTLEAIPLTIVAAFPIPLALWTLAVLIEPRPDPLGVLPPTSTFAAALAPSLDVLALVVLVLRLIAIVAGPAGLAETHFRWPKAGLVEVRRAVRILQLVGIPLAAVIVLMQNQGNELWINALGRAAFIAIMVLISGVYAWVLAPWRPFVKPHLDKRPGSALSRTRWLWYPALIAAPLVLAVLAAAGFYYTALQLDARLQSSFWLILVVAVLHATVLRWLFVERRRLLVERARVRREAEADDEDDGDSIDRPAETESLLEVPEIDAQTRRVLTAAVVFTLVLGVYALWTDVLPALRMLERVQVYPTMTILDEDAADAGPVAATLLADPQDAPASSTSSTPSLPGMPATGSASPSEPIGSLTLDEIALAIIVITLTFILSRNLPGLLEITILKRLPLDAAVRFAISAVLRYLLAIIGILIAFAVLGIGWSKVQWLVAALTFGLAFGLQEIFANFISGLIILAERPIRVGDVVTVNQVSGTVTKIQMRATTIRDWELKELVIPNKVFITDQVINWSLTDPKLRVNILVGVSYSSDVRLVERTLLEIGTTQPHVVEDPRPRSLFLGFGDSTLNFELRVYIEHFDYVLATKHDLHMRIIERFRELDIEIAFPQRDLNIRAIGPLEAALRDNARDRARLPDQEQPAS